MDARGGTQIPPLAIFNMNAPSKPNIFGFYICHSTGKDTAQEGFANEQAARKFTRESIDDLKDVFIIYRLDTVGVMRIVCTGDGEDFLQGSTA